MLGLLFHLLGWMDRHPGDGLRGDAPDTSLVGYRVASEVKRDAVGSRYLFLNLKKGARHAAVSCVKVEVGDE